MSGTRHGLGKNDNPEEDWAPVAEDIAPQPRSVSPRPPHLRSTLEAIAGATDARHCAEVSSLEAQLAEITTRLELRDKELFATKAGLTKARAQAAVLNEELRKRGGTKHYSNLAVKLGVAEAEIRSLAARKMQLAVRLAHVERERDKALQAQATAEAALHKLHGSALATTGESKGSRQSRRQTSYQEHRQHPPSGLADNGPLKIKRPPPGELTSANEAAFEERSPGDHRANVDARGDGMGEAALNVGSAGIGRGRTASNDGFSGSVSSEDHDPHALRRKPVSPDERKVDGVEVKGPRPFSDAVDEGHPLEVPVGDRGLGGTAVVRKRTRGGAALSAALERARESERRCVSLLAATSRELEIERRETKNLRDTLHRIEVEHNEVTGGDYAETDAHSEKHGGTETTAGVTGGGDRLDSVLETGRGSVLQALFTAAGGLLDANHEFWSVGVVASFVFGVVFAAAATAGTLLFRTLLL